jgi:hypothetical protein
VDLGFGSPSATPYDLGFGSPSSLFGVLPGDTGFGSPTPGPSPVLASVGTLPDDGGEIVALWGVWDADEVYRVHLRPSGGGPLYPPASEGLGCYSARPGRGADCRSVGRRLVFTQPQVPPGVYDILVSWPLGSAELPGALTVLYRGRASEVNRLRRAFPATWNTGPANPRLSTPLVAANEADIRDDFPHGGLRFLTRAFGQEIQNINGRPETLLVGNVDEADTTLTVETTLAFPDAGGLFIDGRVWTYTGRTATTFTGCAPTYILGRGHPDGAVVAWAGR